MPGGGQEGLVAPPPTPPANPVPIVGTPAANPEQLATLESTAAGSPTLGPARVDAAAMHEHASVIFERRVDQAGVRATRDHRSFFLPHHAPIRLMAARSALQHAWRELAISQSD